MKGRKMKGRFYDERKLYHSDFFFANKNNQNVIAKNNFEFH